MNKEKSKVADIRRFSEIITAFRQTIIDAALGEYCLGRGPGLAKVYEFCTATFDPIELFCLDEATEVLLGEKIFSQYRNGFYIGDCVRLHGEDLDRSVDLWIPILAEAFEKAATVKFQWEILKSYETRKQKLQNKLNESKEETNELP